MTEENKGNTKPMPYGVKKEIKRPEMLGNQYGVGFGRPEEWTEERLDAEAKALEEWFNNPKNYYLQTFAAERGYTSKFYEKLAEKSQRFSQTLSRVREIQEARIVSSSLERKFDGNFAKFVLANRHGWKEKTEVSGDAANPLSFVLGNIDGNSKDIIDISDDNKDS